MAGKSLNRAEVLGHLGADPELRYSGSGMAIATLSVATNERYKDGEEWKDRTEWHRVIVFDKLAEIAGDYLKKGSQVYLAGSLQTRSWEDKEGVKRYTTEIKVNDLVMCGQGGGGGSTRPPHPADSMEPTHTGPSEDVKQQVTEEDAKPTF